MEYIVRDDRVCRLCQALGYRGDTTGSIPVKYLVHFMLDCTQVSSPCPGDISLILQGHLPTHGSLRTFMFSLILTTVIMWKVVRCISHC